MHSCLYLDDGLDAGYYDWECDGGIITMKVYDDSACSGDSTTFAQYGGSAWTYKTYEEGCDTSRRLLAHRRTVDGGEYQ